ncbi:YDG domain-containing protein [Ramlibacter sp. XY19]|uniref:YDG domain-containing protein n=1 Tax=Ramlibacter paludis TaxID=2908000 RepID=UPI0023DB8BB1|nr:YDG domain-containing protein [Ramlibacter paludis]MCG2594821.1 YDG domain-containing protein [Ramlibacter paludis]
MPRLATRAPRSGAPTYHPALAGFRPAAAALAVAAAFTFPFPLRAQPVGGQAVAGQASFVRNGANLLVTTQNAAGSNHSAINWQSFSVPLGSVTQFNQPSATSTSINRVLGPDPSSIFGTLSSNGRLVLVNPAGIAVGKGAVVDTAGFTASTLPMSEADAIAGRLRFAGNGGALQVDGSIVARSGDVVLIAPTVQAGADAVVQANGSTVLAAGQKVEITGRGLEGIRLEVQAPENQAVNLGTLKGDAVGIFAGTLKHSGMVQATAVTSEGGKVLLKAQGDNLVSGAVQGRSIDVLGERVGLLAGAAIDASGAQGGGQVRIGGDYQGQNPDVQNAKRTYVDARATIKADATEQGNGGRVIVWSDEATRMHGQISARGGAQGGDGGFVEVSGKDFLAFTGRADTRAPQGTAGTLLLDPNDVEIVAAGTTLTNPSPQSGGYFDGGDGTTQIDAGVLGAQLEASDVQVTTSYGSNGPLGGQIHLMNTAAVNWGTGNSLSLNADKGIVLDGAIYAPAGQLHFVSQVGDIVQNAGSTITAATLYAATGAYGSTIGSEGGRVLMDTPGASNAIGTIAGHAYGPGAEFRFQNVGALTIGSVSTYWGGGSGITVYDGPNAGAIVVGAASGNLTVNASSYVQGGTVQLKAAAGDLNVDGASVYGQAGGVFLDATGSVNVGLANYSYLQGSGGGTGGVRINAGADVNFGTYAGTVYTARSPIDITAGGSILGGGYFYSGGSPDGWVHLTATNGSASFNTINSNGSYSGLPAGPVRVVAKGDVTGNTIYANSSYTYDPLAPAGGDVWVESSQGSISLGSVYASGASNYSSLGPGGGGGTIMLRALGTGGEIRLAGSIDASGGYSYQDGGQGGTITIQADGVVSVGGGLTVSGGSTSYGGTPGNGGRGGDIDVSSANGSVTLYSADVRGGSTSMTGNGGDGGTISLRALGTGGTVTVQNTMSAQGGYASDGDGGKGGAVQVQTDGNAQLTQVDASGGSGGPAATAKGGDGGTLEVTASNGGIAFGTMSGSSIASYGGAMVNGGSGTSLAAGGLGGAITLQAQGGAVLVTDALHAQGGGAQNGPAGNARTGGAGNAVTINAAGGIDVNYIYIDGGSMYAGAGGLGGKAVLSSTGGNVRVAYTTAEGSQGGEVRLTASGGSISVDNIDVTGRYGYSTPGGEGGTIVLNAAGDVSAGGTLYANGSGSDSLPAGKGGTIALTAGGSVFLNTVSAYGGYAYSAAGGGAGGTIQVLSTGGDVNASGSLDASGSYGGKGGAVTVTADAGNLSLQGVSASGGYTSSGVSGGDGGTILLRAPGTGALGGNITVAGTLEASGGGTYDGGTGGKGGTITVQADKQIQLAWVTAPGGHVNATLGSGGGGTGGTVLLSSSTGNVAVSETINVVGGNGIPGGTGGSVQVLAPAGSASLYDINAQGGSSMAATATGGTGGTVDVQAGQDISFYSMQVNGGDAYYYGSSGNGGQGGTVLLRAGGQVTGNYIYAFGGNGGNGQVAGEGGGAGGTGGVITVEAGGGDQTFDNLSLAAGGGNGGYAFYDTLSPAAGGAGGGGGSVTVKATAGNLTLQNVALAANGGIGGYDNTDSASAADGPGGGVKAQAAGNLVVATSQFTGGASFTGMAGGNIDVLGVLDTGSGTATLTAAATVSLQNGITSAAAGDAVVVAANNIDVGVSGAINTANGRWLVYLPGLAGNNFGTLASDNYALWGRSYTANPPGTIAETGNRYLFAMQPTVDIVAKASSKVYDGTALNFDLGFTNSPLVDAAAYGNVFLQDVFTGALQAPAANKNVGSYAISLGTLGVAGYLVSSFTGNIASITPRTLTVGATAANKVYDGTTAAAVTGFTDNRVAGDALTLSSTAANFDTKNVGTAKPVTVAGLGITGTDAGNYVLASGSTLTSADITPRTLNVAATAANKVYDGTTVAAVTGFSDDRVAGDALTLSATSASFNNKNVGAAKPVTVAGLGVTGTDAGNYVLAAPSTVTSADITARTLNVAATAANKVYDGTTAATVTGFTDDRVAGDTLTLSSSAANFNNKNVGTAKPVTVTGLGVTGTDAGNYVLAGGSTLANADITARTLTVGATAANKVYDGTTAATVTGFTDNRVAGDALTLSSGSASFNNKNVGTAKPVTVAGLGVSGTDAGNYVLAGTSTVTSADITARTLTVGATAANKVYDGTTAATVTGLTDNRVPGDTLTLSSSSASFDNKNVGTAKPVTVAGLGVTGTDAGNYVLAGSSTLASADITPRALTVSATAANKVYDATTAATVSTLNDNRVAGDTLTVSAGAASFNDKNVGTAKPVNVTGLALSGADAGNYTLASTSAASSANITPRPLNVVASAQDKVYDATTVAAVTTTDDHIAGDALTVKVGASSFSDKNAGLDKTVTLGAIGLTGADAGNYMLTGVPTTSVADITQRSLVIALSAQNKVYDATTAATASATDNHLAGDSVAVAVGSANFSDKNVGTAKTVTASGLTLTGADAGNYALAGTSATATADITPRPLSVAVSAQNKEYDATTAAVATASDNRIAGDALTVGIGSASFADKNVGSGKAVSIVGITLSGADAGNYALATTSATSSASITPAPVTVAADNLAKAQGTELVFAGTEFSASGLKGGESITSVSLASPGAPSAAPVGAYAITPSAAVGGNGFLAGNYTVTYLNGALGVFSPAQQPEINGPVATFATLFVEQAKAQDTLDKKKTDIGKDDIVVTDTQCKP